MEVKAYKYFTTLVILLALCFTSSAFAADWVSFNGGVEGDYRVTVLSSDNSGVLLQIELQGMFVDEVRIANQVFQDLKFYNFGTTQDIGFPALPVVAQLVAIPGNYKVKASVVSYEIQTLEGYNIMPFQTPTTDEEAVPNFIIDQNVYSTDAWYPQTRVELGQIGIMRDLRVVPVRVVPFSYNPVTDQLQVATTMTVKIDFYGISDEAVKTSWASEVSPRIANWYRSTVANFDNLGIRENGGTDEFQTKYLIICPPNAVSIIQPLADFRNNQGYGVEIRVMETGFSTADQFHNYIHELYLSDGLEYVLFVGDWCQATGHNITPMYYWSNTWSDSWYTMVDPWPTYNNDYLADLAAGRFVYDNDAELQLQMDKTMDYLLNPSTADNWAEHTLLVAHEEQYPQKYTQCKEEIRTFAYSQQIPIFGTAYGGAGATNQDVINYLNGNGSGILNYRGHGSQTAWYDWGPTGDFNASHIAQLTNEDKLFVHFDVCCDNMDFPNYWGNCFCESFMKHDYGCVAIHSAIIPSYTIPNHDYDKEFYKAIYHLGIHNVCDASNYANITVYNIHGSLGESNIRTYLWLGDGSIDPWTNTPQELIVDHLPMAYIGFDEFDVSVDMGGAPVEGAMVCAQNEDTYTVGYTDAAGNVTLEFDGALTTPGDLHLMVTCHNGLPYQVEIPVTVQNGPYVVLDEIEINDTQGNNNGKLNVGEATYLTAILENIGNQSAAGVEATLTTSDPYTTIIDGEATFGTIAASATATVVNAFEIEVSDVFSAVYYVDFELTITSGINTWDDEFTLAVIPNLYVTLDPETLPIVIPANGGSFNFNIGAENLDNTTTTFDVWTMVTLPNGSEYGPIINVPNKSLSAGASIDRDRSQSVPGGAPSGAYTYDAYVGDYPNFAWDEDHFDFSKATDSDGGMIVSDWANWGESFEDPLAGNGGLTPAVYSLGNAYPNPFNPLTTIDFNLPEASQVTLTVYNLMGQRVAVLQDGMVSAGYHSVVWNAADLSSGVYFYHLQAGEFSSIKKCVLMK